MRPAPAPDNTDSASVSAAAPVEPEVSEQAPAEVSVTSVEESVEEAPQAEFDIYGPFHEETTVLTYWKLWPPFLEGYDPKEASLFATLADALNVEVEVTTIGTDSADTKFNLMVASGDYLDLIENAPSNYAGGGTKAIQDEVLVDLMPYMETYAPDYWAALQQDEIAMKTMINADDQMAAIVSLFDQTPVPQSGLWIRQDWLREKNMKRPVRWRTWNRFSRCSRMNMAAPTPTPAGRTVRSPCGMYMVHTNGPSMNRTRLSMDIPIPGMRSGTISPKAMSGLKRDTSLPAL